MPIRFTAADVDRAHEAWGCSCGPAAFAAVLDLTLDEARPHFGSSFPGYTNPTLMFRALNSAGARWRVVNRDHPVAQWPTRGLCRVQWEGPWTERGANPRWAYRFTHWIGSSRRPTEVGIWDINALAPGSGSASGWCTLESWSCTLVPWLLNGIPRANGRWHVTHAIEVGRP